MSQDLDLFDGGGEVGPYSPDQPLAPQPGDWGRPELTPREIDEYTTQQPQRGGLAVFGQLMPAGATPQQVQQVLGEIGGTFIADMHRLNHPPQIINAAFSWVQNNALQPIRPEPKRHNYDLHDMVNDPAIGNFANDMARIGASQSFISAAIWWIEELERRLGSKPVATDGTPTDDISDAEYDQLAARSENDRQAGLGVLREKWGNSYHQNLQTVADYYGKLSQQEQDHFDTFVTGDPTGGVVHALNSPLIIESLYNMSVGAGSIPSGASLQTEIEEIEAFIRLDRKRYNKDLQIQARLRTLYDIRDKR